MELETSRLIIRHPKKEDINSCVEIWSHPDVRKYIGGSADRKKIEEAFLKDFRAPDSHFKFHSIIEKKSKKHIGDCGLVKKEIDGFKEVELLYFFNPKYWDKGYAFEAAITILNYARTELNIARVVCLIHPENEASKKLATKLGMTFEKKIISAGKRSKELFVTRKKRILINDWNKKVLITEQSFNRARQNHKFPFKFYENMFKLKKDIRKYFIDTDFEHQHKALLNGLEYLFGYLKQDNQYFKDQIQRLAVVHSKKSLDIHPHEYYYWSEALIMTIREFDTEWKKEYQYYFREIISYPLSFIISHYFIKGD